MWASGLKFNLSVGKLKLERLTTSDCAQAPAVPAKKLDGFQAKNQRDTRIESGISNFLGGRPIHSAKFAFEMSEVVAIYCCCSHLNFAG